MYVLVDSILHNTKWQWRFLLEACSFLTIFSLAAALRGKITHIALKIQREPTTSRSEVARSTYPFYPSSFNPSLMKQRSYISKMTNNEI